MDNFDKDCLDLVTFVDIEKSYGNMPRVLVKLNCKENNEETLDDDDVNSVPNNKPTRTLLDFARESCHFPKLYHLEKQDIYETFLSCSNPTDDILESLFLRGSESTPSRGNTLLHDVRGSESTPSRGNTLLHDVILMSFKTIMSGVQRSDLEPFTSFVKSVRDIIWYISPHTIKFHSNGCGVPQLFSKCCLLNNPKRHGHKVENLDSTKLLTLTSTVTGGLEKTWINRREFSLQIEANY